MSRCEICGDMRRPVAEALGICGKCLRRERAGAQGMALRAHAELRRKFGLPEKPPRAREGQVCGFCANRCRISPGEVGYCGVRRNEGGGLVGGGAEDAVLHFYHDPLPTNCVASWCCPAETEAGYPAFTFCKGPEFGYFNLAVFYHGCCFHCLFCQNWQWRLKGEPVSAERLARALNSRTACICYFGGDPSPNIEHSLAASHRAREINPGRTLRVCWETNGRVSRPFLEQMAQIALETGGCIKFDLKAWSRPLHRALCGVDNAATLANFRWLAEFARRRPDPPLLAASTLLVPGYVEEEEVSGIAGFSASLDPMIPYSLLAFAPQFAMSDLPTTSRGHAQACLAAAEAAGLKRVRLGNTHLLGPAY